MSPGGLSGQDVLNSGQSWSRRAKRRRRCVTDDARTTSLLSLDAGDELVNSLIGCGPSGRDVEQKTELAVRHGAHRVGNPLFQAGRRGRRALAITAVRPLLREVPIFLGSRCNLAAM